MAEYKILIIEDEEPAANRLRKMVKEILPDAVLLQTHHSVKNATSWLQQNEMPDLIISDIQLSDGISFEIFKALPNTCPVIFTTAFDQYAVEAFKVNSIDYILKPVKKPELEKALNKFSRQARQLPQSTLQIDQLLKAFHPSLTREYKKRFAVRYGDHIKTINTSEIAYFNTEEKINFLTTFENRRYITDFNLEQLETMLDPAIFFRINRQFIISIQAISEMLTHTKGRVLIKLSPASKHETIVSAERSADFKHWLDDSNTI
jgi:DNA-binding LytR/AlgR family response regulator